jgi:next-to-BRCA1 protein 1
VLDQSKVAVYKQLYRAAKAKHKLKLRVTLNAARPEEEKQEPKQEPKPVSVSDEAEEETRQSVEPTDTEREAEQPVVSDTTPATVEESSPEPAPEAFLTKAEKNMLASMQEALNETTAALEKLATASCASATGFPVTRASYAVCCNSCDRTIPDAHYHCSTCDDGDFDLCQDCVDRGVTCKGPSHWLIKRFVKNGVIINSTTERLAPKPKPKASSPKQVPRSVPAPRERIIPVFNDLLYSSIRTCNCCVQELPEVDFLHCTTCDDYDLCRACFAKNRHGHHPKHAFVPAVEGTALEPEVSRRLAPGRGQVHRAICDGCDVAITGIRHKCLSCPDWDYCSTCIVNAGFIHPGHRFVPIYEPLEYDRTALFGAAARPVHVGICCDGPLCSGARATSSYIVGDRFKCAVCHDTDFCASCEASPANTHNHTHPLIKFKTPVRHVNVTTTGETLQGKQMPTMGDRSRSRPAPPQTPAPEPSTPPSLISGVQTVVDVKPSEPAKAVEEKPAAPAQISNDDLVATFVRDTIPDGTVFGPDHVFEQTWVLRNTGKVAWPAGCSVKFVGGDYMGHLDPNHPAATRDVEFSCESTICYASIQPGEEYPFTVLLRTPARAGRVVSNWRLTTKEGFRFGHRLWCDVVVEKEKAKVVLNPPTFTLASTTTPELAVPEQDAVAEEKEVNPEPEQPEPEPQHSQMIFPKLEKESPSASVHEEAQIEVEAEAEAEAESSAAAQEPQGEENEAEYEEGYDGLDDEYEDCQDDDEWNDAESVDGEGYPTDEEYDILDASDEEFASRK